MPKKNRKRVQTTLDQSLLKKAKILAVKQDVNLNDIIEAALEQYLKLNKAY